MEIIIYTDTAIDIINDNGLKEFTEFKTLSDLPLALTFFRVANYIKLDNIENIENKEITDISINALQYKLRNIKSYIYDRKSNNKIELTVNELERLCKILILI